VKGGKDERGKGQGDGARGEAGHMGGGWLNVGHDGEGQSEGQGHIFISAHRDGLTQIKDVGYDSENMAARHTFAHFQG